MPSRSCLPKPQPKIGCDDGGIPPLCYSPYPLALLRLRRERPRHRRAAKCG
jgi:hypothetical protein